MHRKRGVLSDYMSTIRRKSKRSRNRAKEMIDLFGVERGIVMALNCSIESYVYFGQEEQQRWINELKRCRVPEQILTDVLHPSEHVAERSAEVIVMTEERRSEAIRSMRIQKYKRGA